MHFAFFRTVILSIAYYPTHLFTSPILFKNFHRFNFKFFKTPKTHSIFSLLLLVPSPVYFKARMKNLFAPFFPARDVFLRLLFYRFFLLPTSSFGLQVIYIFSLPLISLMKISLILPLFFLSILNIFPFSVSKFLFLLLFKG